MPFDLRFCFLAGHAGSRRITGYRGLAAAYGAQVAGANDRDTEVERVRLFHDQLGPRGPQDLATKVSQVALLRRQGYATIPGRFPRELEPLGDRAASLPGGGGGLEDWVALLEDRPNRTSLEALRGVTFASTS